MFAILRNEFASNLLLCSDYPMTPNVKLFYSFLKATLYFSVDIPGFMQLCSCGCNSDCLWFPAMISSAVVNSHMCDSVYLCRCFCGTASLNWNLWPEEHIFGLSGGPWIPFFSLGKWEWREFNLEVFVGQGTGCIIFPYIPLTRTTGVSGKYRLTVCLRKMEK